MPIFQIPGVGPVSLPDGLKEEEYEQVVRKLVEQSGAEPEGRAPYTTGELFKRLLEDRYSRCLQALHTTFLHMD